MTNPDKETGLFYYKLKGGAVSSSLAASMSETDISIARDEFDRLAEDMKPKEIDLALIERVAENHQKKAK